MALSFFRKLRQQLMMTSKFSKYTIYAIGEILLIGVGILLALQVNNWNEQRKEDNLEKELLKEVYHSIKLDTVGLNSENNLFQSILFHSEKIFDRLDSEHGFDSSLDSSFAVIPTFNIREADYFAFNRIESVGIEIIKDDSLKFMLNRYYHTSKRMNQIEEYFEIGKYFRQTIYPKYFKHYKYGSIAVPESYERLQNSNEFRIALDYCINDSKFYSIWSNRRKEDAKWILSRIIENISIEDGG